MSIDSGRKLALELGVSQKTVREYLARPDWPVRKAPPWPAGDVERVRKWQATLQEDRAAEDEGEGKARTINLGYKLERMLHERVKRKRAEGSVVERALLDGALEALAKLFVASLAELERSLPLQLAGLDPGQVEKVVKDRVRSIREQLASRQVIELESIEQAAAAAAQPKARGRRAGGR